MRLDLQYLCCNRAVADESQVKGDRFMSMPKDEVRKELTQAWGIYMAGLGKSLSWLEKHIEEARNMAHICTAEWCEATEHVVDDLNNALFSISEPRWMDEAHSRQLKHLKRRVYDVYADYRSIYKKAA